MTCLLIFKKLMTVLKNINANNFLNIKILKIKIIFLKSLEKDDFNGIKTARNKQVLRKLYVFKLRVSVFSEPDCIKPKSIANTANLIK